ncbi:unnamed protein product [Urochloa humidicola]
MDEVWCDLDLQQLQAGGLHPAPVLDDHDPFWPALADCAASFLAGDTACFGVADIDLSGSGKAVVDEMDASSFFADNLISQDQQQQPVYSSSSLSSKRTLSIDSGGTSTSPTTFFPLDDAAAGLFSSPSSHPAANPFAAAGGDEALMLQAMMAVISSSASPSSSESSSPALSQADSAAAPAAVAHQPPRPRGGNVTVRSSSLAVAPERTTSLGSASGGGRQQQEEEARGSSQVYHMMSERKRREKLNDSFHTLRSLLPPCSKKDKTTVLINAASFLKTLEAQVSELEEKNAKLERHVPREGGGATAAAAAAAAHRRAYVHVSRSGSDERQVSLMVVVMVECDIVDLVLRVLECLRWMSGVSVLSVDADTYSPQALLKARANIKLHILDGDCWNEALFHEAMTKAVHDATSSSPSSSSCAAPVTLVAAA